MGIGGKMGRPFEDHPMEALISAGWKAAIFAGGKSMLDAE